jgi:hypothetical protein
MLLIIFLVACQTSHHITLYGRPCLYPFYGYNFMLCDDFVVDINSKPYVIPKGFTTDLASIPRALWSIYSPSRTETIAAAVVHDYLYFCPNALSRKESDSIFYDILILQGIPYQTAFKYWMAVRLFGYSHFNEGASCIHVDTGTKNTNGDLRLAGYAAPVSRRFFGED